MSKEERRRKILNELIDTEKSYQQQLLILSRNFEIPLRLSNTLSLGAHQIIFANLKEIITVNQQLLKFLKKEDTGKAFLKVGPFLKLYTAYVANHGRALETLQESMKNSKFMEFLKMTESKEELGGLKLNALLIMPVQRIPRYKLLLEDLLENTPDDHADYENLLTSVGEISEIATHINEHIHQQENFEKVLAIQSRLLDSPKLVLPGRRFVKEGLLHKVSRKDRNQKQRRMIYLFSDILVYAKPRKISIGALAKQSWVCSCVLPLRNCVALKPADNPSAIRLLCDSEELVLLTKDEDETNSWIDAIDTAIKELSNKRKTLRKESSHRMPVRRAALLHQHPSSFAGCGCSGDHRIHDIQSESRSESRVSQLLSSKMMGSSSMPSSPVKASWQSGRQQKMMQRLLGGPLLCTPPRCHANELQCRSYRGSWDIPHGDDGVSPEKRARINEAFNSSHVSDGSGQSGDDDSDLVGLVNDERNSYETEEMCFSPEKIRASCEIPPLSQYLVRSPCYDITQRLCLSPRRAHYSLLHDGDIETERNIPEIMQSCFRPRNLFP